jgi:hypothetical protein
MPSGSPNLAADVCLPGLRDRGAGTGTSATDRRRATDRSRPFAAVSAGSNSRPPGPRPGSLGDWVGRAAFLLRPVHERLLAKLKQLPNCLPTRPPPRCSIPDAAAPPTLGLCLRRSFLARDGPAIRCYVDAPDRKAERIVHLAGFAGIPCASAFLRTRRARSRTNCQRGVPT